MATFTAVVSDPETGLSYQVDVDGQDGNRFVGREIGDSVDGDAVGLPGYTVAITGGSDAAGRPLHEEVGGSDLSEVLLAEGPGYRPTRDGERRRVTVRGREIGEQTVQLNLRIEERGDERVEVLLGDADPEDFADEDEESEVAGEDETEEADAEETADEEVDEADEEADEPAEEDADADSEEPEATESEDESEGEEAEDEEEAAETEQADEEDEAATEESEESESDAAEATEDTDASEDETADDDTEAEDSDDESDADEDDEE